MALYSSRYDGAYTVAFECYKTCNINHISGGCVDDYKDNMFDEDGALDYIIYEEVEKR